MRFSRSALSLLVFTSLPTALSAQSNAVPGTDAQVYDVTDISYHGRRGPAYPGGEVGLVMGHSYCNVGTVNIPWASTSGSVMIDTYPKIAFLLARESGGRMVQVSGPSYLKHSVTPYNFSSGPCAPCTSSGGPFMFVGCSDTYSSGINSNRYYLAPSDEVNPWLGTWDPQGSYFDRGDPAVSGPAATDSVRSLTSAMTSAFDAVKNRMEVRESELSVPGNFYGQVQLVIQGEPVGNRGNNIQSRPMNFGWSGSSWNASATGSSQTGSVLTQWTGATSATGSNGFDDGRFLVAVKVTPAGGGMWHYEYAVHNLDNSRAGASLRVPMASSAVVQNIGARDIDANSGNDWSWSRNGNELAFLAGAGNALEWNTLYNFWFDCDVTPSLGQVLIDQARPGAGLPDVAVNSQVPSGIPTAYVTRVGTGCGDCTSSFYEEFQSPSSFDLANSATTLSFANGAYSVGTGTGTYVVPTGATLALGDDSEVSVPLPFSLPFPGGSTSAIRVCSNGFISPLGSNGTTYNPSIQQFLTGQPRWAATWHDLNPAAGGQVRLDSSAAGVNVTWVGVPNFSGGGSNTFQYQFLPDGTVHVIWQSMTLSGNAYIVGWTPGNGASDPGNRDLSATLPGGFSMCTGNFGGLVLSASARPILGTTINLITSDIPSGTTSGVMLLSFQQAVPPQDLGPIGMPGCELHVIGGSGMFFGAPGPSVQFPLVIPTNTSFTGINVVAQTVSHSPPLTPLGLITSNGLILVLGLQ